MVVVVIVSGCFNPQTWDFQSGRLFDSEALKKIENELKKEWCKGSSILGGEPLEPENFEAVTAIAELTKKYQKDCVVWTGYYLDELNEYQMAALKDVDVVVDGPFIEELKDLSLKWRGSSNQRIWHKIGDIWMTTKE